MATKAKPEGDYVFYRLTLNVRRFVGGTPKHPEIIKRWQEAHLTGKEGEPTTEEAVDATLNLLGQQAMDPDEVVAGIWTGFITDEEGNLATEARNVKAMLKESANIVRVLKSAPRDKKGGPIPLKARVAERVFPTPEVLTLMKDGKPIADPESGERPIHVMTAQGPRTALKRTDFVEGVQVQCKLEVLNDGLITENVLRLILDHAKRNGIGTDRSQGNGTFEYELEQIDE